MAPGRANKAQSPPSPLLPLQSLSSVSSTHRLIFFVFFLSHLPAAIYSPIHDCDETYNYWEPTHYLTHGYGLQTWEYAPQYGIRSWTYILPHALITTIAKNVLPILSSVVNYGDSTIATKPNEFIFLRVTLGAVCAFCETRLFGAVSRALNVRIAWLFLLACVSSAGFFHASVAFLPSSFAMYTAMLGMAASMGQGLGEAKDDRDTAAESVFWYSVGGLLGWPFAWALAFPYVLERLVTMFFVNRKYDIFAGLCRGGLRALVLLAFEIIIDSLFYQKLVCAPLNLIMYNVFNSSERGSQIFGTEKWYFYIQNLIINFNLWLPLATLALPLVLLHDYAKKKTKFNPRTKQTVAIVAPFYLWLAIFTIQPHKEERFMYPAYPALALNAALSLHIIFTFLGAASHASLVGQIPVKLRLLASVAIVALAVACGILRTLGISTAYSAPMKVMMPLHRLGSASFQNTSICFGKEWYRFPSSNFLPDGAKAKFVKSEFTGLLPGEFSEIGNQKFPYPGTSKIPSGMNDQNLEDPDKYTNIESCDFIVDSYFEGSKASDLEPEFLLDTSTWEKLECQAFLDPSKTSIIGRLIWVPDWHMIPNSFRRKWATYCLMKRKAGS